MPFFYFDIPEFMISFASLSILVLSIKKPVIDKSVSCYSSLRIVTAIVQEVACFHTGNLFLFGCYGFGSYLCRKFITYYKTL